MTISPPAADIEAIADEVLAASATGRPITPFSARPGGLDLPTAYRAAARIRERRVADGAHVVGRKIGFTNRRMWQALGVTAPVWSEVYDRTCAPLPADGAPVSLAGFLEPRIEPEIVFGLAAPVEPGLDEAALLERIDWVALGFELVQSVYPGWRFAAADTVAAFALHGALWTGPRQRPGRDRDAWRAALARFEIDLLCDGLRVEHGHAENVLGGPLTALRHFVEAMPAMPDQVPLAAGDVVSTGTLTLAMPVAAGQRWQAVPSGLPLAPITLAFA